MNRRSTQKEVERGIKEYEVVEDERPKCMGSGRGVLGDVTVKLMAGFSIEVCDCSQ